MKEGALSGGLNFAHIFGADDGTFFQVSASPVVVVQSLMKPRFVAPAQTLEKSLRDQIRASSSSEKSTSGSSKSGRARSSSKKKEKRKSVSPNPPAATTQTTQQESTPSPPQASQAASMAVLQSLSITDEEKEKRLAQEGPTTENTSSSQPEMEASAAAEISGIVSPAEDSTSFTLEGKPFLQTVFNALDSTDNDYLALFGLCLIYAMQQNAGKHF